MYSAQSKKSDEIYRTEIKNLTRRIEEIAENAPKEAAETDSVEDFPRQTIQKIAESGLLSAVFPKDAGGLGLGTESRTQLDSLNILKILGRGNLVVGRVFEGHLNAVLLVKTFGTNQQLKDFAEIVRNENALSGVWNTQAADGVKIGQISDDRFLMAGWKIFATGVGFVDYPIVNGDLNGKNWQMCLVPVKKFDPETDRSWWQPLGMKSTGSFRVCFDGIELSAKDLIGKADDYYRQPLFSGGAIRFAAVQLGGAAAIFDETRRYLQKLERTGDAFQKMRAGQMAINIESGNLWLKGAAENFENYLANPNDKTSGEFLHYANMMRTAIEEICQETIVLCEKSVGARGLNKPFHFERIIRDLSIYLRQPAPDASLAEVGKKFSKNNAAEFMLDTGKLQQLNLTDYSLIESRKSVSVKDWGKTLVVAPHPDDESLGCGGAIALLREAACEVFILVLSDGTLSHPNSKKFPAEKLRDLREKELTAAAKVLGVKQDKITFFRYRDRNVPQIGSAEFAAAVNRCRKYLSKINPQTLVVPWRRDPHPDHRAAFCLFEHAKNDGQKILEYPIWLWELAENQDAPIIGEVSAFRLDIKSVVEKKQKAIGMHKSQITDLIDDDPAGFRLSEEILANFAADFEIYLEQI